MMQKRLIALLLITVLVLAGGLYLSQHQVDAPETAGASGPLIPELDGKLNEVSALKITAPNTVVIAELARHDEGWVVVGKSGYPADMTRVREYLIKLGEAALREAKTSKPDNYGRLGVSDLNLADAKGTGVELSGLAKPVSLIVGISSGGGTPGTFVRRAGEAQSYLVSGDLVPEKEPGNWLAKNILDVPAAQVKSVLITAPDGAVLAAEKADPNAFNYTVKNLPKGAQLSSESAANLLAGVLASLALEDVVSADSIPVDPKPWKAVYTTYDGLVVETTLWDQLDKSHARFNVRVDDAELDAWVAAERIKADAARAAAQAQIDAAAAKPAAPVKPGETPAIAANPADQAAALPLPFDAEKTKVGKRGELEKQAAEINARTAKWTYVLPSWKAINIKKRVADMLMTREAADAAKSPIPAKP
jgi:hypothetical protein